MKSNPNAKDPNWQVPVKLKGVEPEAYAKDIPSGHGSAAQRTGKQHLDAGPPDYTLPGRPSSRATTSHD
jgi:hypothetical protein